ncbi:MAG: DUF4065 domain-containing protein [Lachnospiraceae bacterium]|nr:DUF4065 domain-containing protein [Lachnospiraceae bacterium]MBO5144377.1 DUF4065 domain-containing protein [Lachnospiraceae bacterium]
MESIYEVARYFLTKESMSHKKLQKLCYFAQAWFLANYGKPLVPNRFEAWVHGPVCPDLYNRYRGWGWEKIPVERQPVLFDGAEVAGFLDKVYDIYGDYTADELERITHTDEPWNKARINCAPGSYSRNPIALKDMRDYYGERIGKVYGE